MIEVIGSLRRLAELLAEQNFSRLADRYLVLQGVEITGAELNGQERAVAALLSH